MVQTPLIFPGGKTLLLPHLKPLIPPHEQCIDLFGGGGAFILLDEIKNGVYNDINGDACNFFRVLRDAESTKRLIHLLRETPYSREEYFDDYDKWTSGISDPVERARCWFVVINLGFTHEETNRSFRVGTAHDNPGAIANHVDRLYIVANKVRRHITIENLDFRDCLRVYDKGKGTFIFADPPYITSTDDPIGYRHVMTARDHWNLLELLNWTESDVILCGYESEMYFDMLRPPKWQLVKKVRMAQVGNSDYSERSTRTEHIWVKKGLGGLWDE